MLRRRASLRRNEVSEQLLTRRDDSRVFSFDTHSPAQFAFLQILMSTWQQHALCSASGTTCNQSTNNHTLSSGSNSVEIPDGLGEINHTSTLSGDFGKSKTMKSYIYVARTKAGRKFIPKDRTKSDVADFTPLELRMSEHSCLRVSQEKQPF